MGVVVANRRDHDRPAAHCSGCVRRSVVGSFARIDQLLGDVAEFDVEVLRSAAEHVEGLVAADAFAFHEDALRLADQFPGHQCLLQLSEGGVVGRVLPLRGECDTSVRCKDCTLGALAWPERVW